MDKIDMLWLGYVALVILLIIIHANSGEGEE